MTPGRLRILLTLSLRSLSHGWPIMLCLTMATAAALVPLLVLFGLRYGIVTTLIDDLRADPRITEIRLTRDLELDQSFFDTLAADPRVGFVLPRARYLAASVRMRGPDAQTMVEPRMVPTAAGDPLLGELPVPQGFAETVISARIALELRAETGSLLDLVVLRRVGETQETIRHPVKVIAVLPRERLQTDDILVSSALESAIEHWREGFAQPALGWAGARANEAGDSARSFASFRLYAADIRDLPSLRDSLLAQGLDVDTQAAQVETVLAIEAGLGWVFWTISLLTAAGFVLTLGLHLMAQFLAKTREFSILRLLGMGNADLALMPPLHGLLVALAGSLVAISITAIMQPVLNRLLDGLGGLDGTISRLELRHLFWACVGTVCAGVISGLAASWRLVRIEPTRGLRHD